MSANLETSTFNAQWSSLQRSERLRLRRLVRIGRTADDPELARLAPAYARQQLERPWMKLFWVWFVPGIVVALGLTASIHPILVGVTIALGAQAVWAHRNLKKTARLAT